VQALTVGALPRWRGDAHLSSVESQPSCELVKLNAHGQALCTTQPQVRGGAAIRNRMRAHRTPGACRPHRIPTGRFPSPVPPGRAHGPHPGGHYRNASFRSSPHGRRPRQRAGRKSPSHDHRRDIRTPTGMRHTDRNATPGPGGGEVGRGGGQETVALGPVPGTAHRDHVGSGRGNAEPCPRASGWRTRSHGAPSRRSSFRGHRVPLPGSHGPHRAGMWRWGRRREVSARSRGCRRRRPGGSARRHRSPGRTRCRRRGWPGSYFRTATGRT
jgi:hypothetical protein